MTDGPDRLTTSVQYLKGVGPQRAEMLKRLGVETVEQLLFYLPRDYQDLTDLRPIGELEATKLQTARGEIVDLDAKETHKGGTFSAALIDDGTGRRSNDSRSETLYFSRVSPCGRWAVGRWRIQRFK
jgi:ATP-dependent DNA helicase RecG